MEEMSKAPESVISARRASTQVNSTQMVDVSDELILYFARFQDSG